MVTLCDAVSLKNTTLHSLRFEFELYFRNTTTTIVIAIIIIIITPTVTPMAIIAPTDTENNT